jgi:hypothetical protein
VHVLASSFKDFKDLLSAPLLQAICLGAFERRMLAEHQIVAKLSIATKQLQRFCLSSSVTADRACMCDKVFYNAMDDG